MYSCLLILLSIIKSETFLLATMISAYQEKGFSLFSIFLYISVGSFFFNFFMFLLGKYSKLELLDYFFSKEKVEKIFKLLDRYKIFFIVFYRFLNGFKLISAFLISKRVSFYEFFIWNIIGDILWSFFIVLCCEILILFDLSLSTLGMLVLFFANTIFSFILCYFIFKYIRMKDRCSF